MEAVMSKKSKSLDWAPRYAAVKVLGRVWEFEIPSHLLGKLEADDLVVVPSDGFFNVGTVTQLRAHVDHSRENVWLIVDKVRKRRWALAQTAKESEADLLAAARERAREVEEHEQLKAKAKNDPELTAILKMVDRVIDGSALA